MPLEGVQRRTFRCTVVAVESCRCQGAAHDPPHGPLVERPPGGARRHGPCPVAWPVAACCAPLLAGAVTLVLVHKAGATFLVLFPSCTAVLVVLMAESGHGLLSITVQRGAAKAKLRMLRSAVDRPALRRVAAGIRHSILSVDGFGPNRRHT